MPQFLFQIWLLYEMAWDNIARTKRYRQGDLKHLWQKTFCKSDRFHTIKLFNKKKFPCVNHELDGFSIFNSFVFNQSWCHIGICAFHVITINNYLKMLEYLTQSSLFKCQMTASPSHSHYITITYIYTIESFRTIMRVFISWI